MNTLDRYAEFEVDGKKYKLLMTLKSILNCEKELANGNLITTMAALKVQPLSLGDAYAIMKWGLFGAGECKKEEEVDEMFAACLEGPGIATIQQVALEAIVKSGFAGKNVAAALQ
ncbi:MAG: GTA-gp10 family protein [Phascolarctobacterium sp.]